MSHSLNYHNSFNNTYILPYILPYIISPASGSLDYRSYGASESATLNYLHPIKHSL